MMEDFEYHPQTEEPNREEIIEGHGWKEIERVGWEAYRQGLEDVSYGQIIDRQLAPIRELQQTPLPPHVGETSRSTIIVRNSDANIRATQLASKMLKTHGLDSRGSFIAAQPGSKKLLARGRSVETSDLPVRRFYFSVLTRKAPEAFQSLIDALEQEDAMEHCDVVLNLETFQADLDQPLQNNTIILYMCGDHPEQMTKVAHAVQNAKEQGNPEAWKMGPKEEGRARESMLRDFIIPLDSTSGFVEMPSVQSYHANDRGRMYQELSRGPVSLKVSTESLQQELNRWTPEKPGIFSDTSLAHRRRYMPGLVFEKTNPTENVISS